MRDPIRRLFVALDGTAPDLELSDVCEERLQFDGSPRSQIGVLIEEIEEFPFPRQQAHDVVFSRFDARALSHLPAPASGRGGRDPCKLTASASDRSRRMPTRPTFLSWME